MLYPPGFYFVKKPKRFAILSSDKSSERNLSSFFDTKKPRRIEHLQSEEPFSSDPYFSKLVSKTFLGYEEALWLKKLEICHASQILTNDRQILVLT
jgi:hypothetical protein